MDLGLLAGMGDWAERRNEMAHQADIEQRHSALAGRKDFADQLLKIGMDESWPTPARGTALAHRVAVLNNPKLKDKDFDKMWGDVWQASKRGVSGAAERNAQRTSVPSLRGASDTVSSTPSPFPSMDAVSSDLSQFFSSQADQREQQLGAFGGMTPESTEAFGPKTAGEHAQDTMRMLSMLGQSSAPNAPGSSNASAPPSAGTQLQPSIDAKGRVSLKPSNERLRYQGGMLGDMGDGQLVPIILDRNQGVYRSADDGTVVRPKNIFHTDRGQVIEEQDADGNPVRRVIPVLSSMTSGATFKAPVRTDVQTVTRNGTVAKFNRNPYTGEIEDQPFAVGTTPNRDIAVQSLGLRAQMTAKALEGKTLTNAINEFKLFGSVRMPDGSEYVPNGAVLDAWNNVIAPVAGSHAYPTTAQNTRAVVARDTLEQMKEVNKIAGDLEKKFGPIQGRLEDWIVRHKIAGDPRVAQLHMAVTHLSAMAPAIHQFRNAEFSKHFEDAIGGLGQPYERFRAAMQAFENFSQIVERGGQRTVMPAARTKRPAPRPVPGAPASPSATPTPTAPPSQNMQIMNQLQQLLNGGASPP